MSPAPAYLDRIRHLEKIAQLPLRLQDELLARASAMLEYGPGEMIFLEGMRDDFVNYLLRGRVERIVNGVTVDTLNADAGLHEHPLDDRPLKQHTIRAVTPVTILRVDRRELDSLYQRHPSLDGDSELEVIDIASDTSTDWWTRLLRSDVFSRLSASSIQVIFDRMQTIDVEAGTDVIRQGEDGDDYYVIQTGTCHVLRKTTGGRHEVCLAELGPGDGFGEEALIANTTRNATVRMVTDGQLMRLGKTDFIELVVDPQVRGVSFRQGSWLVEQGASWVDVRDRATNGSATPDDAIRIPLHLLRVQAKRLDPSDGYVVFSENVNEALLAAFLLAARGLDATYLEEPVSQAMVARAGSQQAARTVTGPPAAEPVTETRQMSSQHDTREPAAVDQGRPTGQAGGRLDRDVFAETGTGEELAELIDEIYRQRDALADTETKPGADMAGVEEPVSEDHDAPTVKRPPAAASPGPGVLGIDSSDLLIGIMHEVDTRLSNLMRESIEQMRTAIAARVKQRLVHIERVAQQRVAMHERELTARFEARHAESEKRLGETYDRLTSLANRISHQKADIQKARKALEEMLQTANRVHLEVHRVGNALVDQIDHLDVLNDDIETH